MDDRPWPVTWSSRLLLVLVLAGLAVSVLTVVFGDDLDAAWSEGRPADSAVQPLDFVPVVVVLYVTVAVLILVLRSLMVRHHNWARHSLAAIVVVIALSTLAALQVSLPGLFVGVAVASLALDAALLVCLWHPRTTTFLRAPA